MLIAITGTPGTGKTSLARILEKKGFRIIDLKNFATDKDCIISKDKKRDSLIIDVDKLDGYIKELETGDLIFIDGHLSHLFSNVDKVILLRCSPNKLKRNLKKKNWKKEKINENLEAEILDIILSESLEFHKEKDIFEIDTTDKTIDDVGFEVLDIIKNDFKNIKKYKIGKIDWSEEILNKFRI